MLVFQYDQYFRYSTRRPYSELNVCVKNFDLNINQYKQFISTDVYQNNCDKIENHPVQFMKLIIFTTHF